MAANYLPLFRPGQTVTFAVTDAVKAGDFVGPGGADWSVKPAVASSDVVIGQAGHDAEIGDKVTVEVGKPIHEATAAGAITRGTRIKVAGASTVATYDTGTVHGIALASAADGALVPFVQV